MTDESFHALFNFCPKSQCSKSRRMHLSMSFFCSASQVIITNSNIWRSHVNWTIKSVCVQKIYYKKSFRVFFDFTDQDQAQKGFWFSQFPFWGRKIIQFLKRVEYYMQLVSFASRWLIHIKKQLRQMSCDWETCRINLWSVLFFFFFNSSVITDSSVELSLCFFYP